MICVIHLSLRRSFCEWAQPIKGDVTLSHHLSLAWFIHKVIPAPFFRVTPLALGLLIALWLKSALAKPDKCTDTSQYFIWLFWLIFLCDILNHIKIDNVFCLYVASCSFGFKNWNSLYMYLRHMLETVFVKNFVHLKCKTGAFMFHVRNGYVILYVSLYMYTSCCTNTDSKLIPTNKHIFTYTYIIYLTTGPAVRNRQNYVSDK